MLLSRSLRAAVPRPVRAPQPNPWAPAPALLPRPLAPNRKRILAIIPTAGRDLPRLRRCLASLEGRADPPVRPVLVVCPAEGADPGVWSLGVEAVGLPGPFNYPRSVNRGLRAVRGEGYALLLNDDCELRGDLDRLRSTLQEHGWACAGPLLLGEGYDAVPAAPVRINAPICGACVLWDLRWLRRVGPYDERFGLGYGFDESDQHLRALRMGATWGLDGRVQARHERHGTFGGGIGQGPHWESNLTRWRDKYPGVHFWGGSPHWTPLPGIQVVVTGNNVAPWIERCLASVAASLAGFRWGLAFADDGSDDDTAGLVAELAPGLGADWTAVSSFPKAPAVGLAKNRALALAAPWRRAYPAVFHMDADDVMRRERATELLWRARDAGLAWAHAGWLACGDTPYHGQVVIANETHQKNGGMSACASVMHASLLPADSRLSDETLPAYEDSEWMLRFWLRGLVSVPLPEAGIVHEYWHRAGSVQTSGDREAHRRLWLARRAQLLARG